MNRKRVLDWVVYLAVRTFVCIVQSLRIETCAALARAVAVLATDILRVRQRVIDENLSFVFPHLDANQRRRLTREMWEHLVLMVCEIAHAPRKIHRNNWHQHVSVHRKQELVSALLDDRPVLLVSGHFGNFELGGFVTGLLGFPSYTVARRLDNQLLDDYVNRFRSANGQFIVPKDDSAGQLDRLLESGAILTLLGDQHAGGKGCWVDFFGRPASCHKAIAIFSLTRDAPLLVVYTKRCGRPMQFEIGMADLFDPASNDGPLASVRPLTQWYNQVLEREVRANPTQYWWLHRRWKEPPPRRRRRQVSRKQAA